MALTDTVVVTFDINESGCPYNIQTESYQNKAFAKSVEDAVRKWRFDLPSRAWNSARI